MNQENKQQTGFWTFSLPRLRKGEQKKEKIIFEIALETGRGVRRALKQAITTGNISL